MSIEINEDYFEVFIDGPAIAKYFTAAERADIMPILRERPYSGPGKGAETVCRLLQMGREVRLAASHRPRQWHASSGSGQFRQQQSSKLHCDCRKF